MSNVFHSCLQLYDQRSSFRGDQPQSGHRMRAPEGSWPFVLFGFTINNNGGLVVHEGKHASIL